MAGIPALIKYINLSVILSKNELIQLKTIKIRKDY